MWEGAVSVCIVLKEVKPVRLVTASQTQPRREELWARDTHKTFPRVLASSAALELDAGRALTCKQGDRAVQPELDTGNRRRQEEELESRNVWPFGE